MSGGSDRLATSRTSSTSAGVRLNKAGLLTKIVTMKDLSPGRAASSAVAAGLVDWRMWPRMSDRSGASALAYNRYIIAWKLCTVMKAADVTDTLDLGLEASCGDRATVMHKPRLLRDNGSSYVAADLADYLSDKGMDQVRGARHHPQTQGKIERWRQTMKNRVLLENYVVPGDLEQQITAFVDH